MRGAYDLCLFVGCPHPDYLLGRDTMEEFGRRGLTPRQWKGWLVYLQHIPLPHDRADFATAWIRADIRRGYSKSSPKVAELVPAYGMVRRRKTEAELKQEVAAHVAAKKKQTKARK